MANDSKNANFSFKNNSYKNFDIPKNSQPQTETFERIPTVPQSEMSERIPTVPQSEMSERIPTVPQSGTGERIPTVPQSGTGERIPTVPQQEIAQRIQAGKKVLLRGNVQFQSVQGETFIIDGKSIISADSGESEIYSCTSPNYPRALVAKILKSVTPRDDIVKRKSREKVLEFLNRASYEVNSHILPLIGYGTVKIEGLDYYVDVYPFCEGGDLGRQQGKIPYSVLCEKVIPAVNEALHRFHEAGFVHRDIKPDNLYWYEGEIVLGDFGITCSLRGDEFTIDKTKTGTLGYYAPELMLNEIVPASDYYSFGQTLWTLYKGHMMYSDLLRHYSRMGADEQRARINHAMMSNTYYELDEIRREDSFFEVLIRGLLQYDVVQRFQYEKVKRWLAGDRALAHEIGNYQDAKIFTRALKVFGKECWESDEIAELLCTRKNWKLSKELLYSGYLKDFFSSQSAEFETTRFLDDIMKRYAVGKNEKETPFLNDVGLAKAIMRLNHYQWFGWEGARFGSIRELGEAVYRMLEKGKMTISFDRFLASGIMLEWYQQQPNHEKTELKALMRLSELSQDGLQGLKIACRWLKEFRLTDGEVSKYCGCRDVNELTDYLLKSKNKIYSFTPQNVGIVEDWEFFGILCMWGYDKVVKQFYQLWSAELYKRFELLFEFLERYADQPHKQKIRQFYHDYGPMSYLYWFQQNLELYHYRGKKCNEIKAKIQSAHLDGAESIQQQRKYFWALEGLTAEFLSHERSNLFMMHIGLGKPMGEECIYSENTDAMWGLYFLGKKVPIGYLHYLELREGA